MIPCFKHCYCNQQPIFAKGLRRVNKHHCGSKLRSACGMELEARSIEKIPSTLSYYNTTNVCSLLFPLNTVAIHANLTTKRTYNYTVTSGSSNNNQTESSLSNHTNTNTSNITIAASFRNDNGRDRQRRRQNYVEEKQEGENDSQDNNETSSYNYGGEIQYVTHETIDDAMEQSFYNDVVIGHCGTCGKCSNPHDIKIYDDTKDTLLYKTLSCVKWSILGGRRPLTRCMNNVIGFTSECNDCWIENIMCDLRHCIFTCLWNKMFLSRHTTHKTSYDNNNNTSNSISRVELNSCTACDEKRCGPQFIECAGANRRRSGILSDIERDNNNEVCTVNDYNWWNNKYIQDYYNYYLQEEGEDD